MVENVMMPVRDTALLAGTGEELGRALSAGIGHDQSNAILAFWSNALQPALFRFGPSQMPGISR